MSFLNHFDYIQIVPIIAVILIVIGGLAALFIKPKDFQNSRTFVFISVMASIKRFSRSSMELKNNFI